MQPDFIKKSTEPHGRYDWQYILNIAREHKRHIFYANIIAVFATLSSIPLPLLMPLLVDEVLLDQPATVVATINANTPEQWHGPLLYILVMLFITLLLRLIALLLNVWQARKFTIVAKEITFRLRHVLLAHLEKVSMSEYETLGSGRIASYLVTDLQTIDDFISNTISRFLIAVLTIIGVAVILFYMHWPLALFVLTMNPIVIFFTVVLGKHVKKLKKEENKAFEVFQHSLIETLDAIHQIRADNREHHYIKHVINQAHMVKNRGIAVTWKSDAANRFSFVVFLFGFDMFRAIAMAMVIFSDLSIGQMFAVFGYLWFMMSPVQEILNIQYAWYAAGAALDRINLLPALQREPGDLYGKDPFKGKPTVGIRMEDVYFDYGDGSADTLNGVCLDIMPGETVALVGATGGGKSTLVQILIGLYRAKKGTLYYDDIPATEIGFNVIRENVSVVLQNAALFNDSIRVNLTMGREFDDAHLWKALEIAQLSDKISKMRYGLDAIIGKQGIRLSEGQKQRLAIARMVLNDPKVVILDEVTSALDTETEYQLHKALSDFLKNKTTLIVAHRLSAIRQANRVLVFEAGVIIEQGSHQELLSRDGLYSKLYGDRQTINKRISSQY